MPIPDLGHTGIRTKFSTGAGNGFTPNGAMTTTFRTGIYDTIRNLAPPALGDGRDMKARDYARAVRKHRVDPCGGSLLHAHMSSLEFDTAARPGSSMPCAGGGAVGSGSLRQSSPLGTFRSRFSPPSSPLSARRALAGYGRGRGRGGGDCGVREFCTTPTDNRQALLLRELSSVQLAAAAAAGVTCAVDGPISGDMNSASCEDPTPIAMGAAAIGPTPMTGEEFTAGSMGGRASAHRCGRVENTAKCRAQGRTTSDGAEVERKHGGGGSYNGRFEMSLRGEDGGRANRGGSSSSGGGSFATTSKGRGPEDPAWRANPRARGRRRRVRRDDAGLPGLEKLGAGHHTDDGRVAPLVLPDPNSSSSTSRLRAMPTAVTARRANKAFSRRRKSSSSAPSSKPRSKPRHLKKPFSSDSLLSCLLDVRFGNTRDLSPEKPPGQKWDLRALPVGMTVGMSATAAEGGWDGFDEPDDLERGGGNERELVGQREGARFAALGRDVGHGGHDVDVDISEVRGGDRIGDSSSRERQKSDRRVPTR